MSTVEERREALKAKLEAFEEKQKELIQDQIEIIGDEFKELFARYPKLQSFEWTQYTPYFNDGEACIFGVNRYGEYAVNDIPQYEGIGAAEEDNPEGLTDEDLDTLRTEIDKVLGLFQEEFFLEAFGDHATVRVSREGIDVGECSHD